MNHDPSRESSAADHEIAAGNVGALNFSILTFSDTRTTETDKSGQLLKALIGEARHTVCHYAIVPDDPTRMEAAIDAALTAPRCDVLITTGGTGISRRDSAFEIINRRLEKKLDGFGELFRQLSYDEIGAAAMLSRAIAGIHNQQIIFSVPGSTNAVRLAATKLILPQVAHLVAELKK